MSLVEVKVPDIGSFSDIPVIEVLVKAGDTVRAEDPLITLESDKATMDVPAPSAGRIVEVLTRAGDKVSEGSLILKLEAENQVGTSTAPKHQAEPAPRPTSEGLSSPSEQAPKAIADRSTTFPSSALPTPVNFDDIHASPSVRRLARELDVDLTKLKGTGSKARITKEDIKRELGTGTQGIPAIPPQDFAEFGRVTVQPLSRLKRLSGPHLHRAWLNIPHVTHTDEADITELEAYRKELDAAAKPKGYRVTLLSVLVMASAAVLKQYPEFNASLSAGTDELILKHYYNIGVAVDTPQGLVVPVIKNADHKRLLELSRELSATSQRMREGKIAPGDIKGATFSISSLGGIGGTNFTPIVNAPEVAILGVVRARMFPVWTGDSFVPRLMLPLCLSYDHRVIDGALAARFTRRLAEILGDVRQLVL